MNGALAHDPEYQFDPVAVQEGEQLRADLLKFYTENRWQTFNKLWGDGALDGEEIHALCALWVDGESLIAYQKFDALMSRLIERYVDDHIQTGSRPTGF